MQRKKKGEEGESSFPLEAAKTLTNGRIPQLGRSSEKFGYCPT